MRSEVASGVGYGAIGGAASAALSPDLLKAIDPTGAALSPGQQAAMEGFATLLGGGLAGLAGANAQGGANAALNEVMNNTDDHPETAAKNGGVLSAFGNLLSAVGDQLASAGRGALNLGNMFVGLMQSGAQQTMSQSPWSLAAQGASNGLSAILGVGGGLPPGGPDLAPAGPGLGPGQLPSSVTLPNPSGDTPSNVLLSSGSSDSGSGSSSGQGGPNTGKIIIDGKIAGQLEGRGWTAQDVQAVINDGPVGTTTDNRSAAKTPDGVPRNDSASVYGSKTGYVVVNDRTGEVVQVSGKNDPGWIPDSRITWK